MSTIGQTNATITWTVSAPATGQVEYGTTSGYGSFSALESSFDYTTHSQQLSGLLAGTLYHYRTRSTDAAGNRAVSADSTFVTTAAAAVAPTPTPTPTATPTPTPTATPPPASPTGTRPFPPPTTLQTVSVPSSIDATGATDVSAALNAFVASVPDGSVIVFKAGGTYRLGAGIRFANRHHLVFEGNGATLRPSGTVDSQNYSAFALWNYNSDILIRNFKIVGQNTAAGYNPATNENRYGVLIYGGQRTEITNCTMQDIWADYITVGGTGDPAGEIPARDVWVHDNTFVHSGRMGISVISSERLLIERNTFDATTWATLDIEPNWDYQPVRYVTFRNNRILRGGSFVPEFVSANGGANAWQVHDIVITGNQTDQSLQTDITHSARRQRVTFTNNTAAKSRAATFAHIDGLTYYGNTNTPVYVSDSTNVDTTP